MGTKSNGGTTCYFAIVTVTNFGPSAHAGLISMASSKKQKGAQTPASSSILTATRPTASASLSPVHQARGLTLFCWILDESESSFSVDIEDNLTVDHLKDAIVKKNPVSFQDVDADELDLWKVIGFPPLPTYADNFPTRRPFQLTDDSRTTLAINDFLKMMCY